MCVHIQDTDMTQHGATRILVSGLTKLGEKMKISKNMSISNKLWHVCNISKCY